MNVNVCVITEADVIEIEEEPPVNNKFCVIPFILDELQ